MVRCPPFVLRIGVLEHWGVGKKRSFTAHYSITPFSRSFLLNQLHLTRSPGLVDPGLQRAVHPQGNEPAFARNGLQPVAQGRIAIRPYSSRTHLFHQHDVIRLPGLVRIGLERAVETKDYEPTLARYGLYPIILLAFRGFCSKIDIY